MTKHEVSAQLDALRETLGKLPEDADVLGVHIYTPIGGAFDGANIQLSSDSPADFPGSVCFNREYAPDGGDACVWHERIDIQNNVVVFSVEQQRVENG